MKKKENPDKILDNNHPQTKRQVSINGIITIEPSPSTPPT